MYLSFPFQKNFQKFWTHIDRFIRGSLRRRGEHRVPPSINYNPNFAQFGAKRIEKLLKICQKKGIFELFAKGLKFGARARIWFQKCSKTFSFRKKGAIFQNV
jgi:hypothetical protein